MLRVHHLEKLEGSNSKNEYNWLAVVIPFSSILSAISIGVCVEVALVSDVSAIAISVVFVFLILFPRLSISYMFLFIDCYYIFPMQITCRMSFA